VAKQFGGGRGSLTLLRFPGRPFSPYRSIFVRICVALGALLVAAILVFVEGDCYRDNGEMGGITWIDALYYATVSLSTTGYGDITPVCESARLVNVVVLTPLRFIFLIVLVGTTVEVLTKRSRQEFRAHRWRKRVNAHTIIIGFGVKGRTAAKTLLDSGVPRDHIVIVTPDHAALSEASKMGLVVVEGDGRRDEVLIEAEIYKAANVIIATNADDTSVLVTLTVRRLAPSIYIVAAARESQNAAVLRQSGANSIVPTAESAGHLLGLSISSPVAGALMEDLLDTGRGLEVIQRVVAETEFGFVPTDIDQLGQIVLAIVRDGIVHRFDTSDIRSLQAGDELVVIRHAGKD
jgi:voltage-gated potassium channel